MKKQIHFFEDEFMSVLEADVNEYLKQLNPSNIIDVRYNHYFDHRINQVWYTAMVLYWDDSVPAEGPPSPSPPPTTISNYK